MKVRVLNCTDDVQNAKLAQFGLVNLQLLVGGELVAPGKSREVEDADLVHIQHLIDVGALSVAVAAEPPVVEDVLVPTPPETLPEFPADKKKNK